MNYHEPEGIEAYVKELNKGKEALHDVKYFKRLTVGIDVKEPFSL
jgi:DNA gyrase subunit B